MDTLHFSRTGASDFPQLKQQQERKEERRHKTVRLIKSSRFYQLGEWREIWTHFSHFIQFDHKKTQTSTCPVKSTIFFAKRLFEICPKYWSFSVADGFRYNEQEGQGGKSMSARARPVAPPSAKHHE